MPVKKPAPKKPLARKVLAPAPPKRSHKKKVYLEEKDPQTYTRAQVQSIHEHYSRVLCLNKTEHMKHLDRVFSRRVQDFVFSALVDLVDQIKRSVQEDRAKCLARNYEEGNLPTRIDVMEHAAEFLLERAMEIHPVVPEAE